MRYIQPQITGTFSALTTIKSNKTAPFTEIPTEVPTDGMAYQADE
jgi:hypothetical protein